MTWTPIFYGIRDYSQSPFTIDYPFDSGLIIFTASSPATKGNYSKLGGFQPQFNADGVGLTSGRGEKLYYGSQFYKIDSFGYPNFTLKVWIYGYARNIELTIWRDL